MNKYISFPSKKASRKKDYSVFLFFYPHGKTAPCKRSRNPIEQVRNLLQGKRRLMSFLAKVFQLYIERWPWFLELLGEQLRISLVSGKEI